MKTIGDQGLKRYIGLNTLQQSVMVADLAVRMRDNQRICRRQANDPLHLMKQANGEACGDADEEDDLNFHVGDIHQHISNPPASVSATATSETKAIADGSAAAKPAGMSTTAKVVSGLALAAGLAGAGVCGTSLISGLQGAASEVKVLVDGQEVQPGQSTTTESK